MLAGPIEAAPGRLAEGAGGTPAVSAGGGVGGTVGVGTDCGDGIAPGITLTVPPGLTPTTLGTVDPPLPASTAGGVAAGIGAGLPVSAEGLLPGMIATAGSGGSGSGALLQAEKNAAVTKAAMATAGTTSSRECGGDREASFMRSPEAAGCPFGASDMPAAQRLPPGEIATGGRR